MDEAEGTVRSGVTNMAENGNASFKPRALGCDIALDVSLRFPTAAIILHVLLTLLATVIDDEHESKTIAGACAIH